ncbi:hypothetical protein BC832DRAFT_546241 [Gaertneriomyces semiglobifer]|nr:hypothetical protein BC832DRAFT_546241 [Gaertneriomyces semiglobifer]
MKILPALLGLLACATATQAASKHQKVLLRDVQTLTLYRGELTTGRRLKPIPQIKCVGGDACKDVVPEVIQCRQVGWNGVDPQWECKTDLEEAWRLGKTDVACEGYSSPDDPYILAGSCGVEYSLYRTQKYVGKSGRPQPGKPHTTEDFKASNQESSDSEGSWAPWIFWILVGLLFLWSWNRSSTPTSFHADASGRSGYGHGPSDDSDDYPPPYYPPGSDRPPSTRGPFGGGWPGSGARRKDFDSGPSPSSSSSSSGPGFWTGLAAGAAGTVLADRIFNRDRDSSRHASPAGPSRPSRSTFWAPSSSARNSSPPSDSSSESTRTTTGYGGTRRR